MGSPGGHHVACDTARAVEKQLCVGLRRASTSGQLETQRLYCRAIVCRRASEVDNRVSFLVALVVLEYLEDPATHTLSNPHKLVITWAIIRGIPDIALRGSRLTPSNPADCHLRRNHCWAAGLDVV